MDDRLADLLAMGEKDCVHAKVQDQYSQRDLL